MGTPPFVLAADRERLGTARSQKAVLVRQGWRAAYSAADFCAPGDTRVHLGLLPQPFCGDLRRASVYLLLLNPGLGPDDYYGECEVPAYRAALLANLKQRWPRGTTPFVFLDPRFAWHGGFGWWHGKLARVIEQLALKWAVPYATARARLGSCLASIELFPYHSATFRDAGGWLRGLPSVELARRFVRETVVPRVRRGEAIVIATRQVSAWGLPRLRGVVTYTTGQARAAHLTPESPGGKAILRHLTAKRDGA